MVARRPDLRIDRDLGDAPVPEWRRDLDHVQVPGNRITTETVFFHRNSGTAIFADLLQQFPAGWFRGWRAVVARLDLMATPRPEVPRKFRLAFRDQGVARAAVARILDWPSQRVVMAHGTPVLCEGQAELRRAFAWL